MQMSGASSSSSSSSASSRHRKAGFTSVTNADGRRGWGGAGLLIDRRSFGVCDARETNSPNKELANPKSRVDLSFHSRQIANSQVQLSFLADRCLGTLNALKMNPLFEKKSKICLAWFIFFFFSQVNI